MTRILLAALFAVILTGCDSSGPEPTTVRESGLVLSATLEPDSGRVGENRILFELRDDENQPVSGAELTTKVHMHAMGAMPAMGGMASVSPLGSGRYQADFELEMGSTWLIEVRARTTNGKQLEADGSLTVGTPGLSLRTRGASPTSPTQATTDAPHPGAVAFDAQRLQRIGIRSAPVRTEDTSPSIRTVGRVTYDETTLRDVSLKVSGWVGELAANAEGILVRKGQVLFTVYSPELLAAEEEYLQAVQSQAEARSSSAPDRADYLVRAARRRLELWDIAPRDIAALTERGSARDFVPVRAPSSGYVIQKNVVEGSAVSAGSLLFRIAPIDRVWVEADVYQAELPAVNVGQAATVSLPNQNAEMNGTVSHLYPYLENASRTARVRVELENPDHLLLPDMFVDVSLHAPAREALVAPESAVLHAGDHAYVFLETGEGRFEPREVSLGTRRGDHIEIRSGLAEGDNIVVSGTFLIASESRLRSALEDW